MEHFFQMNVLTVSKYESSGKVRFLLKKIISHIISENEFAIKLQFFKTK